MVSVSLGAAKNPHPMTEVTFGNSRKNFRVGDAICAVAKALWPIKTAAHLSASTDVSQRMAEYWLNGKYDMSLESVQKLIRSDEGYEFLSALMGNSTAKWWSDVQVAKRRVELRRTMSETQKEMRSLRD